MGTLSLFGKTPRTVFVGKNGHAEVNLLMCKNDDSQQPKDYEGNNVSFDDLAVSHFGCSLGWACE